MKVCIFVLNNCRHDARVLKEARTLTNAGHDVRIIALLDEQSEPYEERDGFKIIRINRDPVHRRAFRTTSKAISSAVDLILQLYMRAYHWAKRRVRRPSSRGEESSTSALSGTEGPYTSVYLGNERLARDSYLRKKQSNSWVRRLFYWVIRAVARLLDGPLKFCAYYQHGWEVIRDEAADIYHSYDLATLAVAYMAKRRTGGKLVYDQRELFTIPSYIPRAEHPALRWLDKYLNHRADAVITVNEFIAGEMSRRYGIGLPVVVRNCPPLASQGDEQHENSLRESLGLDHTVPIIVHVGMFSKSRGVEQLISAAPFLTDGVIVFLGWGLGEEEAYLKRLVRRRGLGDRVLFAPPVAPDQVTEHISSAQVGVIPFVNVNLNHYYATPNKLWECINAGLPVVASNFPALKAIVEGYRLGCTCDPEYPRDIANAINYVLADKSRYKEMKKNALETAKIFNWENESAKLLQVYRGLSHHAHDGRASCPGAQQAKR